MSTVTLRSLRPELANKLNELEVGAAVLERDARNGSAVLAELGLALPPIRHRVLGWRQALTRSLKIYRAAFRSAIRCFGWIARLAKSTVLATALRTLRGWLGDAVRCLTLACATLVAFALVILLVAPPD
jgi:hypothetical protein